MLALSRRAATIACLQTRNIFAVKLSTMDQQRKTLTESYVKTDENIRRDGLKTVCECLRYYSDTLYGKEALVVASSDRKGTRHSLSWREIYNKSITVAESLITLGVKREEFVAVNIRTCPEWLYIAFGTLLAGARLACLTCTYKDGSDLLASLKRLETCTVLAMDPGVDGHNLKVVQSFIERFNKDGTVSSQEVPSLKYVYGHAFDDSVTGIRKFADLLVEIEQEEDEEIELPDVEENDLAVVFQTSGTTGVPKLVAHTHKSLVNVRRMMNIEQYSSRNTFFNDRPFSSFVGFPHSVICGQSRVALSEFDDLEEDPISRLIDIITEEGCNLVFGLPPFIADLVLRTSILPQDWPVEFILTGGQPLTQSLSTAAGKICKKVICGYSLTETGYISQTYMTEDNGFKDYSCGYLVPGNGIELKVVDEQGNIMPLDTTGEIWLKGPGLFKEYLNDKPRTLASFTEDGWFKTDDMGRVTENGEIFVDARKPYVIVSGALNVAPEILETFMQACAGIEAAVIVPVPCTVQQNVLCACVVLSKGSDLTEEDVQKFCEEVHNDKPEMFLVLPKFYLIFDKLPETVTGKVSKHELEAIAKQKFCDQLSEAVLTEDGEKLAEVPNES